MEPALGVALLWTLFAGTHIGLGSPGVRAALVSRLGNWGFAWLFSLVAAVCFALLVHYYAVHRFEGAPGLGAGGAIGWLAASAIALGLTLALSLASGSEPATTTVLIRGGWLKPPRGLERITRHPFFVGMALLGAGHVLVAPHLTSVVFFGGLAVFSLVGASFQDRKLAAVLGEPYRKHMAETSTLPFAAVIAGRQRIVAGELPWLGLGVAFGIALLLRQVHGSIFARDGLYVIATVLGGAGFAMFQTWRSARRAPSNRRWTTPGR